MTKLKGIITVVFLSIVSIVYSQQKDTLKEGDKVPDCFFETIKGDSVAMSSFRGKYVFIDVWATW